MSDKLKKKVQDIVDNQLHELWTIISELETKLDNLNKDIISATSILEQTKLESKVIEDKSSKLTKEIEIKNSKLSDREIAVRDEEDKLKNLRDVINSEVENGKNTLAQLTREINQLGEERRLRQLQDILDNDERVKEIKAELELRIPQIAAKEKELKNKESDLAIVEARWKKLYEDKGAGFKI